MSPKKYTDMLLPPFAKYLQKYAKKWELSDIGGSLMIPKDGFHFDSLFIRSKRLSYSSDKTWEFIGSVIIINRNDFSRKHFSAFQQLKGYECEIQRKGILKKKFEFIPSPLLEYFKDFIPDLIINPDFVKRLEIDFSLKELINKIKPDKLSIRLFSQPIKSKKIEDYSKEYEKIFFNPSDGIIWNVGIEKYLDLFIRKSSYSRIIDSIVDVINTISHHLIVASSKKT